MRDNFQRQKEKLELELKQDQLNNERVRQELARQKLAESSDRQQFQREVFCYLESRMMAREHERNVECKREKLISDVQSKAAENEWIERCRLQQKRKLVNQVARLGQVEQIKRREQGMIDTASRERQENAIFNERENLERQHLRYSRWQQRLKAYDYGCGLQDQIKSEHLRDLAEKQKLNEQLMLADKEREKHEAMGLEFVRSFQDVLPSHPNWMVIQKGSKY